MKKKVCKKCLYIYEGTGDICPECLEKKKEHKDYLGNMYYVYEFIRLDTNEPFYVGKGKNNRAFRKLPNTKERRLNDIVNSLLENNSNYAVNIICNNITEDEALQLERQTIEEYVYEFGYDLKNVIYSGDEEFREQMKNLTSELWKDESFREKVITRTKEAMQDETIRIQCSDGAKKAWEDEEYRAKITAALKRPRKSAPKTKPRVEIVNVVTNEVVIVADGMSDAAKQAKEKLGFGSKKFAKIRNGEIFEDMKLTKFEQK